jgi:7-carboxy-7-deazaguanine synthase
VPKAVVKIVDVKCPDSGAAESFRLQNLETLDSKDEVKFVLNSRADYEFARAFVTRHVLDQRVNAVLFSPAFAKNASNSRDTSHCCVDPRELAEWMLADNVAARLGLQLHKFIWDPALKGV